MVDGAGGHVCPGGDCVHAGDPAYSGFRIADMWVWTFVDPADNQEGIAILPNGAPAIAADERRVRAIEPMIRAVAHAAGVPVRLRHFAIAGEDPVRVIAPPDLS